MKKFAGKLIILILAVLSLSLGVSAQESTSTDDGHTVAISSLDDLVAAIEAAPDGGTVYLSGTIDIYTSIEIGSLDKTVTLCGFPGSPAIISISDSMPGGECAYFRNLIFSGDATTGIVVRQHGGSTYFDTVSFRNAFNSAEDSVCTISAGTATFRNCIFEESRGINGSHIYADVLSNVNINDCKFFTGVASQSGGCIYSLGNLIIRNSNFTNSSAEEFGGTIYASGTLQIVSSEFSGGYAQNGGHIFSDTDERAQIISCTMSGSQAGQNGGSIYANGGAELSDCSITNNFANQSGGGIWSGQNLYVGSSRIFHNTSGLSGADICAGPGFSITDSSQDYLAMYEQELLEGNLNTAAWYMDLEGNRYSAETVTEKYITPNTASEGFVYIVFALSYEAPIADPPEQSTPLPPADDENNEEVPSENENTPTTPEVDDIPSSEDTDDQVHEPSNFGTNRPQHPNTPEHESSESTTPQYGEDAVPAILLHCGSAKIDTDSLEEFCKVLPQYISANALITRENAAGFLYGLCGSPEIELQHDFFSDIEDSPYRGAINFLADSGIFFGCGGGQFTPSENLTQAQMITILARFTDRKEIDLVNIDATGHWAEASIKTAVASNWIEDIPIDLQESVTFGDFVEVLTAIIRGQNDSD